MRSFRDRNPYVIGIVSLSILGLLVGFAFLVGLRHLFERAYEVEAVFSDAGGLRTGDDVRVAGVKVGRVTSIDADRRHGHVVVGMVVDDHVELGPNTSAEVTLQTLLGRRFVRLTGPVRRPYLASLPADRRRIPVERTSTPFDLFELTRVGTRAVEETDTARLNTLITQLADVSEGKRQQIGDLLRGIADVSSAVNARDEQLRSLLDRGDRLTATLAEKDATLVALLDAGRVVLDAVERRQTEIARGLRGGGDAVRELADLVARNRADLDALLDSLHPTVETIGRRQGDLDRALAVLGPGALGLARAPSHGPWADIYVRNVGPDLVGLLTQLRRTAP